MPGTPLPPDLQKYFANIEEQAATMLRSGDYALSENMYRLMLNIVFERQKDNGRIHKGGYYHQIGFTLVLQKKLEPAILNFLLAYIEDTINTDLGHENDADKAPASRVLRESFHIQITVLDTIKKISIVKKRTGNIEKQPEMILNEFLEASDANREHLLSLCDPVPTADDIRRSLIINLSPDAQKTLQQAISERNEQILRLAAELAKQNGHPDTVEADDIKSAILILQNNISTSKLKEKSDQ
jgi:histone H3/H4